MATENVNPAADATKAAGLAELVAELVEASDKQSREAVAARVVSLLKKAAEPAPAPAGATARHKIGGWAHKGVTQFADAKQVAQFIHVTSERIEPLLEVVRDHTDGSRGGYEVGVLLETAMEAAYLVAQASTALVDELDPVNARPAAPAATIPPDLLHDINARLLDLLPLVRAITNEADTVPGRDGAADNVTGPAHRIASLGSRVEKDVREMLQALDAHV